MNWLDIAILVIAGTAALIGWRIGLVYIALSVVGIAAAVVLAGDLFKEVAPLFDGIVDNSNGANVLGFLVVFVAVLLATAIVGTIVRKMLKKAMLGWVDTAGGLILGLFLSLVLVSAVLAMVDSFPILDLERTIAESIIGSFLVEDFDVVLTVPKLLPDDLSSKLT